MVEQFELPAECPNCGAENEVVYPDIKSDSRFTCHACGQIATYDNTEMFEFLDGAAEIEMDFDDDEPMFVDLPEGEEPETDEEFQQSLRDHTQKALEETVGKDNVTVEPGLHSKATIVPVDANGATKGGNWLVRLWRAVVPLSRPGN